MAAGIPNVRRVLHGTGGQLFRLSLKALVLIFIPILPLKNAKFCPLHHEGREEGKEEKRKIKVSVKYFNGF